MLNEISQTEKDTCCVFLFICGIYKIKQMHRYNKMKQMNRYKEKALLSCICWLFATSWPIARQAPLSMGILQARILEWVAMPSSSGSTQPKNQTQVSCIAGGFFTSWATREAPQKIWWLLVKKSMGWGW